MKTSHNNYSRWLLAALLCALISACGGGGGGSSGTTPTPPVTPTTPTAPTGSSNVVPVSVDAQSFGALNSPFISITLCSPTNGNNCMTIDHILVDTGSVGLRVYAKPLTTAALTSLNLVQQTIGGSPVVECLPFAQGVTWGPVKYASFVVGSEIAANVAIQVIADPGFSSIPTACSSQGVVMDSPTNTNTSNNNGFGANGVLGVGLYAQDCGANCTVAANNMYVYFTCSSTGANCVNSAQSLATQVQNPTVLFPKDNNGVILALNTPAATGSTSVGGTLTFGIDTQANNASSNSNTILVNNNQSDPKYGYITTILNGQTYAASFIDSGSNGYFFNALGLSIPQCGSNYAGFYCPSVTIPLSANITGSGVGTANVLFNVANAGALFANNTYAAINDIAGITTDITSNTPTLYSFDWGLPFFYGRSVYTVVEGKTTTKGTGPYFGW